MDKMAAFDSRFWGGVLLKILAKKFNPNWAFCLFSGTIQVASAPPPGEGSNQHFLFFFSQHLFPPGRLDSPEGLKTWSSNPLRKF